MYIELMLYKIIQKQTKNDFTKTPNSYTKLKITTFCIQKWTFHKQSEHVLKFHGKL